MLKEHLKKHFKRIKTIQLKRHHYVLWWLWIAVIIALASIFWFQEIGTHAADENCTIYISNNDILVDESWTAQIECKSLKEKPDSISSGDIEYDENIIEISNTANCNGTNDNFTCTFIYTWKSDWTSEFNLKTWTNGINNEVAIIWDEITVRNWTVTIGCEWPDATTTIEEWNQWLINLTCNWTITWLNNPTKLTEIIAWGNDIITLGEIWVSWWIHDTITNPTFIINFTWNNSWYVELNIDGEMEFSWIRYKFEDGTKTTWKIEVYENSSSLPTCTIEWDTPVDLHYTWTITVICTWEWKLTPYSDDSIAAPNALDVSWNIEVLKDPISTYNQESWEWDLTLKYTFTWVIAWESHLKLKTGVVTDDRWNYNEETTWNKIIINNNIIICTRWTPNPSQINSWSTWEIELTCGIWTTSWNIKAILWIRNSIIEIQEVSNGTPVFGGLQWGNDDNIYTITYKWIHAWTGNLNITWTIDGQQITDNWNESETITVNEPTAPKPLDCNIIATGDEVDIDWTWNIIVTCEATKWITEILSSTGLQYDTWKIIVESTASKVLSNSDQTATYTFIYTWQHQGHSELKLKSWVLYDGDSTNDEEVYATWITVNEPIPDCNTGWDNDYFITPEFRALNPTPKQIACALYGSWWDDQTAYTMWWSWYQWWKSCSPSSLMTVRAFRHRNNKKSKNNTTKLFSYNK